MFMEFIEEILGKFSSFKAEDTDHFEIERNTQEGKFLQTKKV